MKQLSAGFCFHTLFTAAWLVLGTTAFAAIEVTVNSTGNTDTADAELTLTEAILWMNNPGYRALSAAESNQVATVGGSINRIAFGISGSGPHLIVPPDGIAAGALFPIIVADNLIIDGYSQPGASPNTNPILAANNATIKIVINLGPASNPDDESAFGIVGSGVFLRGMSFLGGYLGAGFTSPGPGGLPNLGGGIQGCWFGVAPDRTTVEGLGIGVYMYQSGGSQVIGTDGDGVNDRNEFNVFVGSLEMAIGIEADGYATTNCRVSGNFIGVMPDGLTAMPQAALDLVYEGDCLESGGTDNLIFGTDSNGIADEDERNIVGGLKKTLSGGGCEALQFWGTTTGVKVMGNYFGVAIDGVTPLGNTRFTQVANGSTMQVGSDGDGVRDALEANIIANHSDYLFRFGGSTTAITFGRDSLFGNTGDFFSDNDNSFNGVILASADPAVISPVVSNSTTRAELIGWVPVSGDPAATPYPRTNALIHIYEADSANLVNPQGKKWLATYQDNGAEDLDPATNYFRFNICPLPISSSGANITVNETVFDSAGGGSSRFAIPVALPNVPNSLAITQSSPTSVTLSWQMNGALQARPNVASGVWTNVPGCSPVTLSAGGGSLYFRIAQ